jgi:hypothetical protein
MTYRVDRSLGYQPWGVTNPWVFANYGQPQRGRGYVSPVVFQTGEPGLRHAHLGDAAPEDPDRIHRQKMEMIAVVGLAMSAGSMLLAYLAYLDSKNERRMRRNRRRAAARRTL